MTDLAQYRKAFCSLNISRAQGISPHKMCMLLAVIDLFDGRPNHPNHIEYEPQLLDRYHAFFAAVRTPRDHANPYFPFFHLRSEGFWHLKPLPGREDILKNLRSARSAKDVLRNIESVSLDDDLYRLLKDREARNALAEAIVSHWFDRTAPELRDMVARGRKINRYEERLRCFEPEDTVEEVPPAYIRDPAFRRVVLEAYDYRCAATGTRIILPDESVMVQAAHIEPFSLSGNDDPRNGLALTPNMHWAMDKHVIAPGPDYKWHVSRQVDRRLRENEALWRLNGTELILPKEQRHWPRQDYLEWRKTALL